jgi:glycosyltransferase involved in cell wall biosynthesis
MGLPELPTSAPAGHPLRERFAPIGPEDPLVLWWGSVWRWLDARTAVEAVGLLAAVRPDIRLVITAGRPANAATDALNVTDEVRRLARDRGLLDRHVFFFDDWIPFDDRHRYLADADVGITLHAATEEATLAARARYMDYLWGSLPAVLAEGDEVAGAMAAAGAALLVPPRDPAATARAIEQLLDAPTAVAARAQCHALAESYRWPRLLEPLVSCVDAVPAPRRTPRQTVTATRQAGGYYARRVVDRCVGALPN